MAYSLLTAQQDDIICPLTHYSLIQIEGTEAEKYLQGQLTCDVTKLAGGESTLTAHCDPKGKMSALFRLIIAIGVGSAEKICGIFQSHFHAVRLANSRRSRHKRHRKVRSIFCANSH